MTFSMPRPETPSLRTRPSMVAGLQIGDEDRWAEFFRIYGPVIRGFALKAGLTETEADEVVQETCIGVARNVAEYRYDPSKCRFKSWMLNLASWRVKNQYEKRRRWDDRKHQGDTGNERGEVRLQEYPARAADGELDRLWDAEWRDKLLAASLENVRKAFSLTQYQIFDLNVLKEWPAGEVARSLGVSMASVYLAKHRISSALKSEMRRLEKQMEEQVGGR